MTTTATATANAVSGDVTAGQPKPVRGWERLTQDWVNDAVETCDWQNYPWCEDWRAFEHVDGEVYLITTEEEYCGQYHWSEPGAQTRPVAYLIGRWDADLECVVQVPEPLRSELDALVDREYSPSPEVPDYDDYDD
jgi:hypothetical protein